MDGELKERMGKGSNGETMATTKLPEVIEGHQNCPRMWPEEKVRAKLARVPEVGTAVYPGLPRLWSPSTTVERTQRPRPRPQSAGSALWGLLRQQS